MVYHLWRINKMDYSIPFYSGDLMPEDFSKWLDTLPKGYTYQMNSITKDRGTYTFFIDNKDS